MRRSDVNVSEESQRGSTYSPHLKSFKGGLGGWGRVLDPHCHKLLSWPGSSGASFLCRGEVEEASLVGEGEALEDESLLPPSEPEER